MARPRSFWPALLLLAALAALIYGATGVGWETAARRDAQHYLPAPEALGGASVAVCVTPDGLCPSPPTRTGDPCSCPHLLRGLVPGHVERLSGEPLLPRSRDWGRPAPATEPEAWEQLTGP
jgi:hypothetical protein